MMKLVAPKCRLRGSNQIKAGAYERAVREKKTHKFELARSKT